jgi:hypothetical protein
MIPYEFGAFVRLRRVEKLIHFALNGRNGISGTCSQQHKIKLIRFCKCSIGHTVNADRIKFFGDAFGTLLKMFASQLSKNNYK